MNNLYEVEKLWIGFWELPFPEDLVGDNIGGIDITSLDTFTAGCIDVFLSKNGNLDKKRKYILENSQTELRVITSNVDVKAKSYFEKLLDVTNKVLEIIETQES